MERVGMSKSREEERVRMWKIGTKRIEDVRDRDVKVGMWRVGM